MNLDAPRINLVFAWSGILLGFISGLGLGLFFHRENWLGGYNSFKRRLYRLGHISFFGLGAVNFFFYVTATSAGIAQGNSSIGFRIASGALVIGAIAMPLCCWIVAHWPQARMLFAVPVLSLLVGAMLTLAALVRPAPTVATVESATPDLPAGKTFSLHDP